MHNSLPLQTVSPNRLQLQKSSSPQDTALTVSFQEASDHQKISPKALFLSMVTHRNSLGILKNASTWVQPPEVLV